MEILKTVSYYSGQNILGSIVHKMERISVFRGIKKIYQQLD